MFAGTGDLGLAVVAGSRLFLEAFLLVRERAFVFYPRRHVAPLGLGAVTLKAQRPVPTVGSKRTRLTDLSGMGRAPE